MRKFLVFIVGVFLLAGCDQLKGDKGDAGNDGKPAIVSSKKYTGSPATNPYSITISGGIDLSKQVIEMYRCNDTAYTTRVKQRLPWTASGVESHLISIEDGAMVSFFTTWQAGTPIYALSASDGTRFYYEVYVRTFATSAACAAYKKSRGVDTSGVNGLIYGRDM